MRKGRGVELSGAVVVVTGAAGGIGSAVAAAFERAGSTVVRTDVGGRGDTRSLDVADLAATRAALQGIADRYGRLDVVVANAGVAAAGLVEDTSDDDWTRIVDINITGSVNTLRGAYPILTDAGRGSIVLMASLAGLMGTPLLAAYGMSKAALVGLGASVRPEAARHGVGVTVVCPGPVETPMLDSPAATPGVSPRRFLTAAAGQPMTPQRLAKHVVHAVRTDRGLVVPGRSGLLWRVARMSPRVAGALTAAGLRRELAAAEPGQVAPSG